MLEPKPKLSPTYHAVRIALGLVYFHFGMLKFFPDLSPAELLASQTIIRLSEGMLDAYWALYILAIMEVTLGVALIFNIWMRVTLLLFLFHMIGTFTPILVLPELAFKIAPLAPTLEGQYILKNIVFVAAGLGLATEVYFQKRIQTAQHTTITPSHSKPIPISRPAVTSPEPVESPVPALARVANS